MRAFRVPGTSELLVPFSQRIDGTFIDGVSLVDEDSEDGRRWAPVAEPLPAEWIPVVEKLRAAKDEK